MFSPEMRANAQKTQLGSADIPLKMEYPKRRTTTIFMANMNQRRVFLAKSSPFFSDADKSFCPRV